MADQDLNRLRIDRDAPQSIRRRGFRWWWLLVAAIIAGAAFWLYARNAPLAVETATVSQAYPSQAHTLLNATGYVVAQRKAAVASKATGRVVELKVREGSVLKAGDLIARLDAADLKALAGADALASLAGHRRQQVWDASALLPAPALLRGVPVEEEALELPEALEGEEVVFDYAALGLTLRAHPLQILRGQLSKKKYQTSTQMANLPSGRLVRACGIVTVRQQPQTAKGTLFVTLEDETGPVNVIVWKHVREQQRQALLRARLLAVHGRWQRDTEGGGAQVFALPVLPVHLDEQRCVVQGLDECQHRQSQLETRLVSAVPKNDFISFGTIPRWSNFDGLNVATLRQYVRLETFKFGISK